MVVRSEPGLKSGAPLGYWLTVAMGLLAFLLAFSSLLLWTLLPLGYYPSRLFWIEVHRWSGLLLTLAVILHLALHWRWLWRITAYILFSRNNGKPGKN